MVLSLSLFFFFSFDSVWQSDTQIYMLTDSRVLSLEM